MSADWVIPDWPAPARVRAVCTTRAGGFSAGPFNSLNLGDHVGDAPDAVQKNRARFSAALHVQPLYLKQVHGTFVTPWQSGMGAHATLEADGLYTDDVGVACAVLAADCLPILLCHRSGLRVAALHAGWRGLAGRSGVGIVESFFQRCAPAGQPNSVVDGSEYIAWLGPCIGPQAFEVGDEVRSAFVPHMAGAATCFLPHGGGKWLASLPALARQRLQAAGVTALYGNDGSAPWCTFSNPSRFFSHRRDGISGRMAAAIWRI